MCEEVVYQVDYKDIQIPIRLTRYGTTKYGYRIFEIHVGDKVIGQHICQFCKDDPNDYDFHEPGNECLQGDIHKMTRALNIMESNGSKLRGQDLKDVINKYFDTNI